VTPSNTCSRGVALGYKARAASSATKSPSRASRRTVP
jgi:hypothetical protein